MSRRHKRTIRAAESVELNLAAMLDMAFQLLTFFILTFRPAPIEGEIALAMPQAASAAPADKAVGSRSSGTPSVALETLTVSVLANQRGEISQLSVEDQPVGLASRLKSLIGDPNSTLKQVVIRAEPGLRYDALMDVVDKCAWQKLPDGKPLGRLSFVELPDQR